MKRLGSRTSGIALAASVAFLGSTDASWAADLPSVSGLPPASPELASSAVGSAASPSASGSSSNTGKMNSGDDLSANGSWHFTTSEEAGSGGGFFVVTHEDDSHATSSMVEIQDDDEKLSKYLKSPPRDVVAKNEVDTEVNVPAVEPEVGEKSQDKDEESAQIKNKNRYTGPCGKIEERMDRRRAWLVERRADQFALGGAPNAQLGIPDATWQWCEDHPEDEECRMPPVTVFFSTDELRGGKAPEEYDRHMILMNRELQTCLRRHDGKR